MKLSYSAITTHERCPYAYKLQYVDRKRNKPKPPSSDKEVRQQAGIDIHQELENYINKKRVDTPNITPKIKAHIDAKKNPEAEKVIRREILPGVQFTAVLDIVDNDDGDICISDLKTGQERIAAKDQLGIYALLMAEEISYEYIKFPIIIEGLYSKEDKVKPYEVSEKDLEKIEDNLFGRIIKIKKDTAYPFIANKFNCEYCNVSEHCEYFTWD